MRILLLLTVLFSPLCHAQEAPQRSSVDNDEPKTIQEISLIVSGADEGHFIPAIERLRNIFRHHTRIKAGSLTVVGNPYSIAEKVYLALSPKDVSLELKKRVISKVMIPKPDNLTEEQEDIFSSRIADGMQEIITSDPEMKLFFDLASQLSIVQELPKELNIQKSPTWLITTQKGKIILEGILEPETFINEKNEFVENDALESTSAAATENLVEQKNN